MMNLKECIRRAMNTDAEVINMTWKVTVKEERKFKLPCIFGFEPWCSEDNPPILPLPFLFPKEEEKE